MISTTLAGAQTMIHFYELPNDSDEYEKFAQITDDGEIIEGADRLLSIHPKERWEKPIQNRSWHHSTTAESWQPTKTFLKQPLIDSLG